MLQKTQYTAPTGSLVDQAIAWFTVNPDEELTIPDVAQKFDVTRSIVRACLRPAVKAGVLLYTRADEQEYIYRLGAVPYSITAPAKNHSETRASQWAALLSRPTEATLTARAADPAASTPKPATMPKPKRKSPVRGLVVHLTDADLEALNVDIGVPLSKYRQTPPSKSKWVPIFCQLTQAGMSIEVPNEWRRGMHSHCDKLNRAAGKTVYRVRMVSATRARVWRLL